MMEAASGGIDAEYISIVLIDHHGSVRGGYARQPYGNAMGLPFTTAAAWSALLRAVPQNKPYICRRHRKLKPISSFDYLHKLLKGVGAGGHMYCTYIPRCQLAFSSDSHLYLSSRDGPSVSTTLVVLRARSVG